jgi:hypothetical protein
MGVEQNLNQHLQNTNKLSAHPDEGFPDEVKLEEEK